MPEMDIKQIEQMLPHRYPFLLVDRVTGYDLAGKTMEAIKNVSVNEPHFVGHFPSEPIMPGVLILESLSQVCALLGLSILRAQNVVGKDTVPIVLLTGMKNSKFRRQVVPGDQLHLHAQLLKGTRGFYTFDTVAKVDGEVAASTSIMCTYIS